MKTKIIPFCLDTAKKIQAGEIEGKIKTRDSKDVDEIVFFETPLEYDVYAVINGRPHSFTDRGFERKWDHSGKWHGDLVLEVPDNEPQFNSPYSIEQLDKLKGYIEQLIGVNQGVIDDMNRMIQELRKTGNSLKTEFKPFDRVLVRDVDSCKWCCDFFSHFNSALDYECIGGTWCQCIPYAGNESLVGTTDKPKED